MLNSSGHEILVALKNKNDENRHSLLSNSQMMYLSIMLINVKMPTNLGILTFMSMINFMISFSFGLSRQALRL